MTFFLTFDPLCTAPQSFKDVAIFRVCQQFYNKSFAILLNKVDFIRVYISSADLQNSWPFFQEYTAVTGNQARAFKNYALEMSITPVEPEAGHATPRFALLLLSYYVHLRGMPNIKPTGSSE